MNNTYISDYERIKERFEQWWSGSKMDRPLMYIVAPGKSTAKWPAHPGSIEAQYCDPDYIAQWARAFAESHFYMGDAVPEMTANYGPGSMALYLGGEPLFAHDTVWYKKYLEDSSDMRKLHYDENSKWWVSHKKLYEALKERSNGDFLVTVPDIVENADILSALRDPSEFCMDLIDAPDDVQAGIDIIDDAYFKYYDWFYNLVKEPDDTVGYTAFHILGKGRTAKIQCDVCALISPADFRRFIQPSLRKQCQRLNHSLYHLDGPDAIKHLPALMEIKELQALQWTAGAGRPSGGHEMWYPIYDMAREAGKSLWIGIYDGGPKDWAESAKKLVKRYGKDGLYFIFDPFKDEASAREMAELFD